MKPVLEQLEGRFALSTISVAQVGNVVQINVRGDNTVIVAYIDNSHLVIAGTNGPLAVFSATKVTKIVYNAVGNGNYNENDTNLIAETAVFRGNNNGFNGSLEPDTVVMTGANNVADGGGGRDMIRLNP